MDVESPKGKCLSVLSEILGSGWRLSPVQGPASPQHRLDTDSETRAFVSSPTLVGEMNKLSGWFPLAPKTRRS